MDRIGDIALFLRVLDLGSISAAARSLDLSVAVASQRLQRLERALGVRLLHRTTRRLHPTRKACNWPSRGGPWSRTWSRWPAACARPASPPPVPCG
jgi:Transcriptional regulator